MTTEHDISTDLRAIEHEMRQMIAGKIEPYAAAVNIWKTSMRHAAHSPDTFHPFWLIWGALTDLAETKDIQPQAKAQNEEDMVRAAREWLSLNSSDSHATKAYFDHWVYEELGYKKDEKPSAGTALT